MVSRKQLFQALALVSLCPAVIVVSSPVEFAPVQAAQPAADQSKRLETLIGEPLSLPGGAISLAPAAVVTTTVTGAEAVDITVRETAPGEPPDVSAYGPDGPITVTVEVVTEENVERIEEPEPETAEEEVVVGEPPPDGFEEGEPQEEEPAPPGTLSLPISQVTSRG